MTVANMTNQLPAHYTLTRTTPTFDNTTVPAGLLSAHRVADGVWGRLVVHSGQVTFVFEDQPADPIDVPASGHVDIPPARPTISSSTSRQRSPSSSIGRHRPSPTTSPDTKSTGLQPDP